MTRVTTLQTYSCGSRSRLARLGEGLVLSGCDLASEMHEPAGKPACVIAAVTIINRLNEIQSTGLFHYYGHAPWYKLVTHLGSVSTLLTPQCVTHTMYLLV